MSEWWTYRLSDFLLFSPRTYYRLFELYNVEIWPAQLLMLALGTAVVVLIYRGRGRAAAALLGGCWLFVAWAFHRERYATINWAADYFAIGFAIEAALLVGSATVGRLWHRPAYGAVVYTRLAIIFFGVWIQPALAPLLGRSWRHAEIFGLAPDPTVVVTLGVLLAAGGRATSALMIIPVLWCVVSGATLWAMESPEAPLLPGLALAVLGLAARPRARRIRPKDETA